MFLFKKKKHHGAYFIIKVLCEKAIILENYKIDLLMLNMSKAFDILKEEHSLMIEDIL